MPEKYERRPLDHEGLNELVDVCKCGHGDYNHRRDTLKKECSCCTCPQYQFEQRMTQAKEIELGLFLINTEWPEIKKRLDDDNDFDPVRRN